MKLLWRYLVEYFLGSESKDDRPPMGGLSFWLLERTQRIVARFQPSPFGPASLSTVLRYRQEIIARYRSELVQIELALNYQRLKAKIALLLASEGTRTSIVATA